MDREETSKGHKRSCTAVLLPVHSNSGYPPPPRTSREKEAAEGSCCRVAQFWVSEWDSPKATSDLLDCISAKREFASAALSLFLRHETGRGAHRGPRLGFYG